MTERLRKYVSVAADFAEECQRDGYEAGLKRALELIPADVMPPKIEGNYKVEEAQWREDMAAEMYNRALAELRTRIKNELKGDK